MSSPRVSWTAVKALLLDMHAQLQPTRTETRPPLQDIFSQRALAALTGADRSLARLEARSLAPSKDGPATEALWAGPFAWDAPERRSKKLEAARLQLHEREWDLPAMPRVAMRSWADRLIAGDAPPGPLLSVSPEELETRAWDAATLMSTDKQHYTLAEVAVRLLVALITEKNYQKLYDLLLDLPLEKASAATTDRLLRILLRRAMLADDLLAAGILEDVWENAIEYSELRRLPLWVLVAAKPEFALCDLRFLARLHEDEGFLGALSAVSDRLHGRSARLAALRFFDLFAPPLESVRSAYVYAQGLNNTVEEVLGEKLEHALQEPAERPGWLAERPAAGGTTRWKAPRDPDIAIERTIEREVAQIVAQRARERAAEIILGPSSERRAASGVYSLSPDARKELLLEEMTSWTKRDFLAALRPYLLLRDRAALADPARHLELFRAYGPCHPLLSADPDDFVLGGERMLLESVRDVAADPALDEDPGDDAAFVPPDWFTGVCDVCRRAIASRWRALRMPVRLGGWMGVFCSFECLRDQAAQRLPDCSDPLLSADNKTPEELMIDQLEADLFRWRIQDRPSVSEPRTPAQAVQMGRAAARGHASARAEPSLS